MINDCLLNRFFFCRRILCVSSLLFEEWKYFVKCVDGRNNSDFFLIVMKWNAITKSAKILTDFVCGESMEILRDIFSIVLFHFLVNTRRYNSETLVAHLFKGFSFFFFFGMLQLDLQWALRHLNFFNVQEAPEGQLVAKKQKPFQLEKNSYQVKSWGLNQFEFRFVNFGRDSNFDHFGDFFLAKKRERRHQWSLFCFGNLQTTKRDSAQNLFSF